MCLDGVNTGAIPCIIGYQVKKKGSCGDQYMAIHASAAKNKKISSFLGWIFGPKTSFMTLGETYRSTKGKINAGFGKNKFEYMKGFHVFHNVEDAKDVMLRQPSYMDDTFAVVKVKVGGKKIVGHQWGCFVTVATKMKLLAEIDCMTARERGLLRNVGTRKGSRMRI